VSLHYIFLLDGNVLTSAAMTVCKHRALPGTTDDEDIELPDDPTSRGSSPALLRHVNRGNGGEVETDAGTSMDSKRKKKGKEKAVDSRSDYEKEWDKNITRNKAILKKLDAEWKSRLPNLDHSSPLFTSRLVNALLRYYAAVDANIDFNSSDLGESTRLGHSPTPEMDASATDPKTDTLATDPKTDTSATDSMPGAGTSATDDMPGTPSSLSSGFSSLFSGTGTLDSTDAKGEVTPSETPSAAKPRTVPRDLTLSNTGAWPPWLSNAVEYLKGISSSPEWVALIMKLVAFEAALGFCNTVSLIQSCNVFRFLTSILVQKARMRQPTGCRTFVVEEWPEVHDAAQDK
jgi:hypothetical protein